MRLENDSARKIDREIEAALQMLDEAQPPAAMTSRIHRRLESAVATSPHAHPAWKFSIPATCAAVAAVLLVALLPAHFTRGRQPSSTETAKLVATDSVSTDAAALQPTGAPVRITHPRKFSMEKVQPHPFRENHSRQRGEYHHAANLFNYPLTRQEKLLVEFAQTAKPEDLQALNPEYQAKLEAQQNAEFAAYVHSSNDASNDRRTKTIQNTQE